MSKETLEVSKDLPGMPPDSELAKLCRRYLVFKNDIEEWKDNLNRAAEGILEELKKENMTAIIVEGHKFEVAIKEEKIKVSEV